MPRFKLLHLWLIVALLFVILGSLWVRNQLKQMEREATVVVQTYFEAGRTRDLKTMAQLVYTRERRLQTEEEAEESHWALANVFKYEVLEIKRSSLAERLIWFTLRKIRVPIVLRFHNGATHHETIILSQTRYGLKITQSELGQSAQ